MNKETTIPILAMVRQQSQRCPNKILRPFYGEKSLLDVTLERYRGRKDFFLCGYEEVFKHKAKEYGVNFIQRNEASAHAEKALEVHNFLYDFDYPYLCYIGVCSPLLKAETVDKALETFRSDPKVKSLFGVKAIYDFIFKTDGSLIDPNNGGLNSKEKPPNWIGTNSIYIFPRQYFLDNETYWTYTPNDPLLFAIDESECCDVDTEHDFAVAQAIYAEQQKTDAKP